MKKPSLLIIAAMIAFIGTLSAQQKIGHLNSYDILQVMPEFKQMSADLEKQKQAYTKALESMYGDYEKKQRDLQAISNDKSTPDAIIESKIQELQDLQKRIQDFEEKVNNDLQKMQQDKLKPINDKYLKAVKEVAQANNYAYVLDVVSGSVAYFTEGQNDVTDLVMKKLGISATTPQNTTDSKTGGK